ncbi:phosphoribosylanthranilate isomerase [Alkalihalobacterium alkalinitrilicum]|uniref:phosphoribosylanthranilate isomerase n=1 Tax=Alkalihalobacterium alkalinitrilicum TaxID=427920 RepID=UPI000ABEC971|nr:phosphoribosylanthranilate isomerase [Alkalihalobacterium alkalinitrilicum]
MQTKLKYCGNHSLQDVGIVSSSKADYIGFVFAESKRKVSTESVSNWLKHVKHKRGKKIVALFVNATIMEIEEIILSVPIDIIQCHGSETPDHVRQLHRRVEKPIWKVIHHKENAWNEMKDYAPFVEAFIIDSKVKGQWGGTGVTFDWSHIPKYIEQGKILAKPVFIAGGINPSNIEQLLKYQPEGIDISSGIEVNGLKDKAMINQIEERIKQNDRKISR